MSVWTAQGSDKHRFGSSVSGHGEQPGNARLLYAADHGFLAVQANAATMTTGNSVTLKDIALVAGVAAEHGIQGPERVRRSERTNPGPRRRRCFPARYRPNAIARSLRVRSTRTLGVITNDPEGAFTTAMVHGVTDVASDHSFGVFLCNSYGGVAKERQHIELLLDKQVDGIILTSFKVEQRGAPARSNRGRPPRVPLLVHLRH